MQAIVYIAGIATMLATMSSVGVILAMILGAIVAGVGGLFMAQSELREIKSRVVNQTQLPNTNRQSNLLTVSRTIACPSCKVDLLFHDAGELQCRCPQCKTTFRLDSGDRIYDINKLEQPAESSDAKAQVRLGEAHYEDTKIQKDHQKAMMFLKAANQGRASAQCHMGTLYIHGQGVPQDYVQASEWFRKAAVQGVADAQIKLGLLYVHGHGVTQDYVQAAEWIRKAAIQGNASAQFNLGALHYNGLGVPQDYVQVAEWFRKAADQGNGDAQFGLGQLYIYGYSVPQDNILAMSWFHIALAHGFFNQVIAQRMTELNALFSPVQIAQAEKVAIEWLAAHH